MTDEPVPKSKHRNYKTRDNYATGGWCPKTDCVHRVAYLMPEEYDCPPCDDCVKFSEYKKTS